MAKVLVVDDDTQLLRMVGMILERGSHLPILESDPLRALERIRDEQPGVVVLDVMMPDLSGHELCAQIRASEELAELPVLMLTARSQSVDREEALSSGADAFLSKPVLPADLMETIDRLLSSTHAPENEGAGGLVISLFSLRGGVGRTTLAANLAAALRRTSRREVCLIDLSPSGGQVVMHLRLKTRSTWGDLPSVNQLDWPALKEHLLMHQSGMRVLAAPSQPQLPNAPSAELTTAVLALTRRMARFTVIDLPAVLSPAVRVALEQSDVVLHVVTPEVVSIQIARHTTQAVLSSELQVKQKVYVLNQVAPEAQLSSGAVENGLRAQMAFQIGYDPNQSRALGQGVPLSLTPASSTLPSVTRRLAQVLWQRAVATSEPAAP